MQVRSAWLYTRDSESIRIEVRDEGDRFLLVVRGPGTNGSHQVHADYEAALARHRVIEQELLPQGFVLQGHEQWQRPRRQRRPVGSPAVVTLSPQTAADDALIDFGDGVEGSRSR